jgi:hypothetical protein
MERSGIRITSAVTKIFYSHGIQKLVDNWTKLMERQDV